MTRHQYLDAADLKTLTLAQCNETHPGFDVVCQKCGSKHVIVQNDMGWSETSGGWGSIDLRCANCDTTVAISEA